VHWNAVDSVKVLLHSLQNNLFTEFRQEWEIADWFVVAKLRVVQAFLLQRWKYNGVFEAVIEAMQYMYVASHRAHHCRSCSSFVRRVLEQNDTFIFCNMMCVTALYKLHVQYLYHKKNFQTQNLCRIFRTAVHLYFRNVTEQSINI